MKKIEAEIYSISNAFDEYISLECEYCHKDLLASEIQGLNIIVFVGRYDYEKNIEMVEDVYWSCKGTCDNRIQEEYIKKGFYNLGWEDISDIVIPSKYIAWICSILNNMRDGDIVFSDKAFEKIKNFIIASSQLAIRDTTEEKKDRIRMLLNLNF